jgi:ElaB/YqjD/DUF883 family membrane-anchored ribosome-binding protein
LLVGRIACDGPIPTTRQTHTRTDQEEGKMESERGATLVAGQSSTTGQAGAVGKAIDTGLEQASVFVKDAVDKTREKIAEYRDTGMDQVSQEVVEYTRSQPATALLIATGIGMVLGMLLARGRR